MAGSTAHWRDVYSVDSWAKMLATTKSSIPPGKVEEELNALTLALSAYHEIPKPVSKNIPVRIRLLLALAKQAATLVELINDGGGAIQKSVAIGRGVDRQLKKTDSRGGVVIKQEANIGPWVHSLSRRATKKAAYLELISDHERVGAFISTGALTKKIATRIGKPVPEGQLRLTPGTKLEKMDFLHRDFEHHTDGDGKISDPGTEMSRALVEWLGSGTEESFYVWLEGHPICTADRHFDSVNYKAVHRITYGGDPKVRRVYCTGGKMVAHSFGSTDTVVPLTTVRGTKAGEAFVWLVDGTLLVHSHLSGQFHHSSFNGGKKVLCAGTMEVRDGKVQGLDNNSGHYQPSDAHFLTLVQLLNKSGVIAKKALFGTHAISDGRMSPFAPMWNLSLEEYEKRAKSTGVSPFSVNPEVEAGLSI